MGLIKTLTSCSMTSVGMDEHGAPTKTPLIARELIRDLVEGEFNNPVRIVAFNSTEGWCRDVTVDIADELRRRVIEYGEVSDSAIQFMEANRR
jgi:hypothetical protein